MSNTETEREVIQRILIGARNRITDRETWIRGNYAVNNDGVWVNPDDPSASKFCAMGAIQSSVGEESDPIYSYKLETTTRVVVDNIAEKKYGRSIVGVNDHSIFKGIAHKRVLKVFDEAIEKLN